MAEIDIVYMTASEALSSLESGNFTSEQLVQARLAQITRNNEWLRAVIETNPTALSEARERDQQRKKGHALKSLHGLPILIKSCIATAPELNMDTISGNFVLSGSRPRRNAKVVQQLLDNGAVILGKTSLSELSFWKIANIPAGWSPVGGQGQNPYVRAGRRPEDSIFSFNGPGGSSSGSSIGVAAGFSTVAIGTETSGSLIFPAERAALFTIKPTAGLISQSGIVPISRRFDTAGPLAKCGRDIALLLDVLVDSTKTKVPSGGYLTAFNNSTGWSSLRVGVLDPASWLHNDTLVDYTDQSKDQIVREVSAAYEVVRSKSQVCRDVTINNHPNATAVAKGCGSLMFQLFEYEYRRDFEHYISELDNCAVKSLEETLSATDEYAVLATPNGKAGRDLLERAISCSVDADEAQKLESQVREVSRTHGIDSTLRDNDIDVLLGPGNGPLYTLAAAAGYPIATLPLSYLESNGCPFGLVALASAHQEALLLAVQLAWEETFPTRKVPSGLL